MIDRTKLKGESLARFLWDNVDMKRNLYNRLFFLCYNFDLIIKDLSKEAVIAEGEGSKVNRINWILQNNRNGYPGLDMQREILSARKLLARYSALNYEARQHNHFISTQELEEQGLTEVTFITTLRQVSTFLAWAYNLVIPEKIQKLIETDPKDSDEIPLDEHPTDDDLANNKSYRFPFIILIDNSLSMGENGTLEQLQQSLTNLFHEIGKSTELSRRVELYVGTCGVKATEIVDFAMIDRQELKLDSMILRAAGPCMMADAIEMALDRLKEHLDILHKPEYGIEFYEPWMLILSDGKFKGDMDAAIHRIRTDFPHLQVYARGVSSKARMEALRTLDSAAVVLTNVEGFFKDVFTSLEKTRTSNPGGERIHLINQQSFAD